ncbi:MULTISPECIES: ABC transporter ATP-binding protein [unclassified Nitrosomonas]|uniref:ABC transporter ATP-binding protein n=1 Tax=unclassified Nitrosomonas TaxID=2609265 RepID=UPI00210CD25C|nr:MULTISPECIES: ABC transporter ATP-binding protein [unclassified Nitrosomonas]
MNDSIPNVTISAHNLSRRFGNHIAVRRVDLELKRGEVLGLLGPNGAGKSTTMQMLTGNLAPTSGSVQICGIDLLKNPRKAKRYIGYLPENPPLYKELTVDEYLRFAARLHNVDLSRIDFVLTEVKQRCGLSDIGQRLISALSKGYQQRVGVAQAIIHQPEIIILDEPSVGLDPNQIREIRTLIRELGKSCSVILSTHILPEVESVCDRVQIMNQGVMVFSAALTELKQKGLSLERIFEQLTLKNANTGN